MGWDQRDAVGELVREEDRVKVFRHNDRLNHSIVGNYVGQIAKVDDVESEDYTGSLQILLIFEDGESGWAHQSSVMRV